MGDADARTDEALMAAHAAGDPSAFPALFGRYAPRLIRMFAREVRPDDARDLTQQTFLQVHRARRDFRADAALRPWLYTIARNLLRQHHRRRGRRPETPLPAPGASEPVAPGGDPERRMQDQAIRRVLSQLPAAQSEVIALHWFEGLSFKEVAHVVGAGESAVKVRAHRGYARLRELLAADGVTDDGDAAYGLGTTRKGAP